MDSANAGLKDLTAAECRTLLNAMRPQIGRIVFMDGGYPVALPINFRMLDGEVVFRTGIGSKLEAILRGQPISFEADEVDASWQDGWSAIIKGRAEELDGEGRRRADQLGLTPWATGGRSRYVVIRAEQTTGRRIDQ